jgi:hypothetical protein
MYLRLTLVQYGSILKLCAIQELRLVLLYAWWWPNIGPKHVASTLKQTNVDTIVSILFFHEYCCVDCPHTTYISREKPLRAFLDDSRLDKTQGLRQRHISIHTYKTERTLLNNAHYKFIYLLHSSCFVTVISRIFPGSYNRLNLVMNRISFS